jgi:hypothetical protein
MKDFKEMQVINKEQKNEMLKVAIEALGTLPENVTVNCWTTSLIVLEIDKSSVFRLLIVDKFNKEPALRIEKDVQSLNAEQESLKKQIMKKRAHYSSIILPLYLKMKQEWERVKKK